MTANAMLIQCKLKRPGGTTVKMADGTNISFQPDENGDHVAFVSNPDHIQRLLSITEGYQIHSLPAPFAPEVVLGAKAGPTHVSDPEPVPQDEPVGPPPPTQDEPTPASPAPGTALDEMTDDAIRSIFEAELGRKPHHNSKRETMIAQIEAFRAEANK